MAKIKAFFLPVLLLTGFVSIQAQEKGFRIVAHRGASYLAPENTQASIKLAWELGADAAECDVMLTSDQEVILIHDKNTKKLTGQDFVVSETPWEQLKELSIIPRQTNLPEYNDEPIPLLKDVLGTIPGDRMLVIEIKTGQEILPHLKKVVDEYWTTGMISFIAFDFETILAVKDLYPDVPCYYLSAFRRNARKHLKAATEKGLDGLNLRHGIINRKMVDRCSKAGLDLWCWTVNHPANATEMKKLGVSAVTTDRPGWLRENMK